MTDYNDAGPKPDTTGAAVKHSQSYGGQPRGSSATRGFDLDSGHEGGIRHE
jgi:hypothetical protein